MPMPKQPSIRVERDLEKALKPYIIEEALPKILQMLRTHPARIAFSSRKGRTLGYYAPPKAESPAAIRKGFDSMHTISLQIDLNPYALLFVFLHEWAHFVTRKQYGEEVPAHGKEWKSNFRKIFVPFHSTDIFPGEVLQAIDTYFIKTSRFFEAGLEQACARYGTDRKAFFQTCRQLMRKGIVIPSPALPEKDRLLSEKIRQEKETARQKEIRRQLEKMENEEKRRPMAEKSAYRVSGPVVSGSLPEGSLFRMEGEMFRILEKGPSFSKAESVKTHRIIRIHQSVEVEAAELAGTGRDKDGSS